MKIQDLVLKTKSIILQRYLDATDEKPWAIAYSGGKDSTAVVGLVVSVIASLPKEKQIRPIHIVMSDTKMETPLVKDHMHLQADSVRDYCERHNLPITMTVVSREMKESYFVKTLGKGYFLPQKNGQGRWCTDHLKIKPQDKYLKTWILLTFSQGFGLLKANHGKSRLRNGKSQSLSVVMLV